jgi:hypothetical protein
MRSPTPLAASFIAFAALALLVSGATPAQASLTLVPGPATTGFTLTTFVDTIPNSSSVGPLGIAFPSNGTVLVADFLGNVSVFPSDANGQHWSAGLVAQNYGVANAVGLVQLGGNFYMTQQSNGQLVQINATGTLNSIRVTGMPGATGLATDGSHLFVSTLGTGLIYEVDPVAQTKVVFANASADGLSVSPDGKTLYGEVNGHILGYTIPPTPPGSPVLPSFDSGVIPDGPDGVGVGAGNLSGKLFVNTNGGTVWEVDIATKAQTLFANGGSRGDFVTVDPNGTLLLTQTDSVVRLTAPAGGTFGPGTTVPEPSTLALLALGGATLAGWRRWRKGQGATA